jgi:hypothetical protein
VDGLGFCVARNDSRSRDAVTRIDGHRGHLPLFIDVRCGGARGKNPKEASGVGKNGERSGG